VLVIVETILVFSFLGYFLFGPDYKVYFETEDRIYLSTIGSVMALSYFYFGVDSILQENIFQFTMANVVHICIWFLSLYEWVNSNGKIYENVVRYCFYIMTLFQFAFLPALSYYVVESFGWRAFKIVGASERLQRIFTTSQMFFSLVKLDIVASTFLLLIASYFSSRKNNEIFDRVDFALTCVAYGFSLVWSLVGYMSVQREDAVMMRWFMFVSWVEPCYVVYKIVQITRNADITSLEVLFFIFAGASFILRGMLIVWAHFARSNFGQGLKERIMLRETSSPLRG